MTEDTTRRVLRLGAVAARFVAAQFPASAPIALGIGELLGAAASALGRGQSVREIVDAISMPKRFDDSFRDKVDDAIKRKPKAP